VQSDVEAIRDAWRVAAKDLGVRLTTGDHWEIDSAGNRRLVIVVVPDFGDTRGMAIFDEPIHDAAFADALVAKGLGYTWLSAQYGVYNRATFVEALTDWGWTGAGSPPEWYRADGVPD
jgi:hypothetical protein